MAQPGSIYFLRCVHLSCDYKSTTFIFICSAILFYPKALRGVTSIHIAGPGFVLWGLGVWIYIISKKMSHF